MDDRRTMRSARPGELPQQSQNPVRATQTAQTAQEAGIKGNPVAMPDPAVTQAAAEQGAAEITPQRQRSHSAVGSAEGDDQAVAREVRRVVLNLKSSARGVSRQAGEVIEAALEAYQGTPEDPQFIANHPQQ